MSAVLRVATPVLDEPLQNRRESQPPRSPFGFGVSNRFTGLGTQVPAIGLPWFFGQCYIRCPYSSSVFVPSKPGAPRMTITAFRAFP